MGKRADELRLIGFEPVVGTEPRILILGSMPSEASLAAGCYYAHPRNRFWRVVGACFGFDPALPYKERLEALTASGAALWDTIESCERTGSLDSAILRPHVNDFPAFFAAHPTIERVCLNGERPLKCGAVTLSPYLLSMPICSKIWMCAFCRQPALRTPEWDLRTCLRFGGRLWMCSQMWAKR